MRLETRLETTSANIIGVADQIVPTFRRETITSKPLVNFVDLASSDLAKLKRDDPFMYYSIPEVRRASLLGKDVNAAILRSALSPQFFLSDGDMKEGPRKERTAKRQTRISVECHPELLLTELYGGFGIVSPSLEFGHDCDDDFF